MLTMLNDKVASAKRTATFGAGGALCLAVGVAFLTVAAWVALVAATDELTAALVIGGTFTGSGLVLFALGSRPVRSEKHSIASDIRASARTEPAHAPELFLALMQGVAAGAAANKTRH